MLLTEYTLPRARRLAQMLWPESILPYGIKIVWLQFGGTDNPDFEVYAGQHSHAFCEIQIGLQGGFCYQSGGVKYPVVCGQGLLFAPGAEHKYCPTPEAYVKCSLAFSVEIGNLLYKQLIKRPVVPFEVSGEIVDALNTILKEAQVGNCFSYKLIAGRAFEAVYAVLRCVGIVLPGEANQPLTEDMRFAAAKEYIHTHLHSMISCDEVARHCGLSPRQLKRIFVQHTGNTLFAYIKLTRLQKCEELLLKSDYSIKEISHRLGFENEYYFSNFFKRNYGIPPGYFRKKNALPRKTDER